MSATNWLFGFITWILGTAVAGAESVAPAPGVTSHVMVREFPSTQDSNVVGQLRPGESAEVLDSVPRWYWVRLADSTEGYVSKRWVVAGGEAGIPQPFQVHLIDVGNGDAIVVDVGDSEIVIDGGMYVNDLSDYVSKSKIIQDPIELAIVTHADADHWRGLARLLGIDTGESSPYRVLEFWEPGYDRGCAPLDTYSRFIEGMRAMVPSGHFRRPLASSLPVASANDVKKFTVNGIPGATFTLLHSEMAPGGPNCAFVINNASIVFMLEINGIKMLFTGDANGKQRGNNADVAPQFVEKDLVALAQRHPDILKADVLKVSHHGSETANTLSFINLVKPRFAIISASTSHHLPDALVVRRYEEAGTVVLRTDLDRRRGNDHVVCLSSGIGDIECNYLDEVE